MDAPTSFPGKSMRIRSGIYKFSTLRSIGNPYRGRLSSEGTDKLTSQNPENQRTRVRPNAAPLAERCCCGPLEPDGIRSVQPCASPCLVKRDCVWINSTNRAAQGLKLCTGHSFCHLQPRIFGHQHVQRGNYK
jgi:hypothetical protein